MIIDTHVHIGKDRGGAEQDIKQLNRNMRAYGIDKAVIFPFDEDHNLVEVSIRLLKYRSSRIIPLLRFDPKAMTPELVESLLEEYNFKGVKLHTRAQEFDPLDRKYFPIYRKIEESGRPVLIHSARIPRFGKKALFNTDPDRIVKLARSFPELNIIVAHFAALSWTAIEEIGRRRNLFLDTSINGTTFVTKMAAERIGADKVIFGSDCPYSDQEIELLKVKKSGLSRYELNRILYKNISSLLNI